MTISPRELISAFAKFVGLASETVPGLIEQFSEAHPELIEPGDPGQPPSSPTDDLDPDVRADIEGGNL